MKLVGQGGWERSGKRRCGLLAVAFGDKEQETTEEFSANLADEKIKRMKESSGFERIRDEEGSGLTSSDSRMIPTRRRKR